MKNSFSWKHVVYSIIVCSTIGIFSQMMISPAIMGTMNDPFTRLVNADFVANTRIDESAIDVNSIVVVSDDYGDDGEMAIEYTVALGDTLSTIASKFGTTVKNIMEANGLSSSSIRTGKKLYIAKTEGFVYQVDKVTNWIVFANQYNIPLDDLLSTNGTTNKLSKIDKGDEVFVPLSRDKGVELGLLEKPKPIEETRPVVATTKQATVVAKKTGSQSKKAQQKTTAISKDADISISEPKNGSQDPNIIAQWTYTANIQNGFARGFCTWYAAIKAPWAFPFTNEEGTKQQKTWNGNARERLAHAKAKGFKTSSSPSAGAIVVVQNGGGGYYSAGHVGIVIEVDNENKRILIEDMNYKGLYIVTRRWIYMDDSMTEAIANSEPISGFIPKQAMPEGLED